MLTRLVIALCIKVTRKAAMFGVRFVQGLGALFNAIRLYTRGSRRLLRGLLSHLRSRGRRGAGSLLVWRSGSRETDSHLNIVSSRPNLFVVVGGDRGRGALDGADGRLQTVIILVGMP